MAQPARTLNPPPDSAPKERLSAIEAVIPHLATKADLGDLENRLIKWMLGIAFAALTMNLAVVLMALRVMASE